jgi:hypothetical protein
VLNLPRGEDLGHALLVVLGAVVLNGKDHGELAGNVGVLGHGAHAGLKGGRLAHGVPVGDDGLSLAPVPDVKLDHAYAQQQAALALYPPF